MNQNNSRSKIVLVILLIILALASFINLFLGYQDLSLFQMTEIVQYQIGAYTDISEFSSLDGDQLEGWSYVVFDLRVPCIIMCILVGLGLGSSGAVLQGLFRNPLVDPGFIGVSSGAGIGAIIGIMFGYSFEFYLPEQVLVKVDRSTMLNSIESRTPFLDHRLIEFVNKIPSKMHYDGVYGKILLTYRYYISYKYKFLYLQ